MNCKTCKTVECNCSKNGTAVQPPLSTNTPSCPTPEPCPEVISTDCIVFLGDTKTCGDDTVYETGDTIVEVQEKIVDYFCEKMSDAGCITSEDDTIEIVETTVDGLKCFDLSVALSAKNVAFVSATYGDDSTAEIDNRFKPFSSIDGAAYALDAYMQTNYPGDTKTNRLVYILPDTYYQTVDLLPNMSYYCEPGVVFISFGGTIFLKNYGTLENTYWYGKAVFTEEESLNANITLINFTRDTALTGNVYIEFDYFRSAFAKLFEGRQDSANNGNVVIRCRYVHSTGFPSVGTAYLINPRRHINVDIEIEEDYITEDGGIIALGGAANNVHGNVRIKARNFINRGSTSVPSGFGATLWSINNSSSLAGSSVLIEGNLVNERTTNDPTINIYELQLVNNLTIKGNIYNENYDAINIFLGQGTFSSTFTIEGNIESVNQKGLAFSANNILANLHIIKLESDIKTENNSIEIPILGCYNLKLRNSSIKSYNNTEYPISILGLQSDLKLYNCGLASSNSLSIYTNNTNPSISSVGTYANEPVDAGVTDNWEGVDTTNITFETF